MKFNINKLVIIYYNYIVIQTVLQDIFVYILIKALSGNNIEKK